MQIYEYVFSTLVLKIENENKSMVVNMNTVGRA